MLYGYRGQYISYPATRLRTYISVRTCYSNGLSLSLSRLTSMRLYTIDYGDNRREGHDLCKDNAN